MPRNTSFLRVNPCVSLRGAVPRWLAIMVGVVVLCEFPGCHPPATPERSENLAALEEITTHFTYNAQLIQPKLIEHFIGYLSDNAPPVVRTVDITAAAMARNEYCRDDIKIRDKVVEYERSSQSTFGYRYLGRMTKDVCALATLDWGGGSQVFANILVLRLRSETVSGHVLMDVVTRQPLGGRDLDQVRVRDGRVELPTQTTGGDHWPAMRITADGTKEMR